MKLMKKSCYQKGSITVEAAYIFPIVILVYVMVIKFAFNINSIVTKNMLAEYEAVKAQEIMWHSYNVEDKKIDIRLVLKKTFLDIVKNDAGNKNIAELEKRIRIYRNDMADEYKGKQIKGIKITSVIRMVNEFMERYADD